MKITCVLCSCLGLAGILALAGCSSPQNDPDEIKAISEQKSNNPDTPPPASEVADSPKAMKGKGPGSPPAGPE